MKTQKIPKQKQIPRTRYFYGIKYRRSDTEFNRKKALEKAQELKDSGLKARVESNENGKFFIYVAKPKKEPKIAA